MRPALQATRAIMRGSWVPSSVTLDVAEDEDRCVAALPDRQPAIATSNRTATLRMELHVWPGTQGRPGPRRLRRVKKLAMICKLLPWLHGPCDGSRRTEPNRYSAEM